MLFAEQNSFLVLKYLFLQMSQKYGDVDCRVSNGYIAEAFTTFILIVFEDFFFFFFGVMKSIMY